MTNAIIHEFEVDQLTDNIKSVTFLRDDGTLQTLNDDNVTISASFTENGTYIPPSGVIGFDSIDINVPPSGKLETIEVVLDDEAQTIRPSVGFDGIGEVRVPKSNLRSLSVSLTPNSETYVAADDGYFGFSEVSVPGYNSFLTSISAQDLSDAGISLGVTKTVTPQMVFGNDTEIKGFSSFQLPQAILSDVTVELSTSEQTITPPHGAYGISEVTIPSVYSVFTDSWTITSNGDNKTPPSPYLGAGKVNVHVQPVLRDYTFTQNGGPYTAGARYDGWGTVNVNVPDPPDPHTVEANKEINITSNGTRVFSPDEGYNVMEQVTVTTEVPVPTLQALKTVTTDVNNDTVTVTPDEGYDAIQEVQVNVQVPATGNVQASKSVTYYNNGTYAVRPDAGYDSVEQVNVTLDVTGINMSPRPLWGAVANPDASIPETGNVVWNYMFTNYAFQTQTTFTAADEGRHITGFYRNTGNNPYTEGLTSYTRVKIWKVFPVGSTMEDFWEWVDELEEQLITVRWDTTQNEPLSGEGAVGWRIEDNNSLLEPLIIFGTNSSYLHWGQPYTTNTPVPLGQEYPELTPYDFFTWYQW